MNQHDHSEKLKNSKNYFIAKIVSRVFDVPIAGILLLYVIWQNSPKDGSISGRTFFFFSFYTLLITILLIILFIRLKIVDNWELTNRSSRKYVYMAGIIILTVTTILSILNGVSNYFLEYIAFSYITLIVFGLITNYTQFKPSLHVAFWTLLIILVVNYYGFIFLPLLTLLPLVGWARLTIKNHTPTDLALGFSIMSLLTLFFLQVR